MHVEDQVQYWPSGYWLMIMMPLMMITMITMPGPARSTTSNLMIHSVSNDDRCKRYLSHHQANHSDNVTVKL